MKITNAFMRLAVLAGLIFPAVCLAGNTTNETNKNSIVQSVSSAVTSVNVGMVGTRIASILAPSGGGGSTFVTPSGGAPSGGAPGGAPGGGTGGTSTGSSSGSAGADTGVWALGGAYYLNGDKPGAHYDGSIATTMVGIDKRFGDFLAGVAVGYERLDLDTKYNYGKIIYDGYSVAPYLSYAFNKNLIADTMFSYTWLDYTMKDTQAGVRYSDTLGANRMVGSVGLTQYYTLDKWLFSGRVGTMYVNEHQDSYTLKVTNYGKSGTYSWQGQAGGRATYDLGAIKPFVGVTYMYDFIKSGGNSDLSGADFDLGLGWSATDSLTVGLTGTYGIRENFYKAGGMLNVRYEF